MTKWFKDEGLEPPENVTPDQLTGAFDTLRDRTENAKPNELLRSSLGAMTYQRHSPYGEVYMGHPIDRDSREGVLRVSSPAKELGHLLFEALIQNSVAIPDHVGVAFRQLQIRVAS